MPSEDLDAVLVCIPNLWHLLFRFAAELLVHVVSLLAIVLSQCLTVRLLDCCTCPGQHDRSDAHNRHMNQCQTHKRAGRVEASAHVALALQRPTICDQ